MHILLTFHCFTTYLSSCWIIETQYKGHNCALPWTTFTNQCYCLPCSYFQIYSIKHLTTKIKHIQSLCFLSIPLLYRNKLSSMQIFPVPSLLKKSAIFFSSLTTKQLYVIPLFSWQQTTSTIITIILHLQAPHVRVELKAKWKKLFWFSPLLCTSHCDNK